MEEISRKLTPVYCAQFLQDCSFQIYAENPANSRATLSPVYHLFKLTVPLMARIIRNAYVHLAFSIY